jgi:hypothetical protein
MENKKIYLTNPENYNSLHSFSNLLFMVKKFEIELAYTCNLSTGRQKIEN